MRVVNLRVFILTILLLASVYGMAQEKTVNIREKSISLSEAFEQIEKQTGYSIAYGQSKPDIKKKISLSLTNATLEESLTAMLKGTGLTYIINGYHIILIPEQEKADSSIKRQTIRGIVTDEASGSPIPYAAVGIPNTSIGTVTDSTGQFKLSNIPIGRYDIQTTYVGYETSISREILVSSKEVYLEIPLKENAQMLDEVVVYPKTNKEETLNPMALTGGRMISMEEANRYAGGLDDPARLATSFAGVAGTPGTNAIAIRGNSPQFLQWKLEGIEIPNPTHFADMAGVGGGLFSGLSSQVMGNSDFFTGAFPAEYSNTLAGVFDMSIRKGNNEKHEHTIQIGLLGLDLASEGPISKETNSSYIFNYRYSTTGLMGAFTDNTGISYQDLAFKLNFPTRKAGTFSVWGIGLADMNKYDVQKNLSEWKTFADRQKSKTTMLKGAGGFTHRYKLDNTAYIKTSLAATYSDNRPKVEQLPSPTSSVYFPVVDMKSTNMDIVFNAYFNKKYSSRHTNRSGITVTGLFYDLDFNLSPNFGLNQPMQKIVKGNGEAAVLSAYSNSVFNLTDKWVANVGANAQWFTLNANWTIEPRLSLKWKFVPKQSLAIAYGLHSRREKLDYYYVKMPKAGNVEVNKKLGLSKAHHFVLTYDLSISDNIHLKVEPYYQALFNIPVEPGTSFSIINHDFYYLDRQLVNKGKGRNYGVDITLERYLNKGYYYMFTGSLFKSEYLGGDNVWRGTRLDRGYLFNGLGGKEWIWGKRRQHIFNANIRFSYQGGDRYTPIDKAASLADKNIVYDETKAFGKQFSPVFTTDFGVSYKLNKKKVSHEFGLQILNITGQTGQYGYYYNEKTNAIEKENVRSLLPNLSYKLSF
ncbi:MAG: carboxypeptidase-like regulatory domain-containing protein [Tannerellaceae bacterium]|nr:carboxypeptidase-like regulatory domain-containing protein [Tannerellaceae bacterium]